MFRFLFVNFPFSKRKFSLSCVRNNSKPKMAENIAYFRHTTGNDHFYVSFKFANPSMQINKQFNFCRLISERAGTFLSRVDANLIKAIGKKTKRKKEENATADNGVTIQTLLLRNDSAVKSDFLCAEIFRENATFAFLILNQKIPVEINAPWIDVITLNKGMMSGFLQYPSKCETFFTSPDCSEWTWSRSKTRGGPWEELSNSYFYTATTADVGHFLRVSSIPGDETGRRGPEFEVISAEPVGAGPGPLLCHIRHQFTPTKLNDMGIRVVSYNILADLYVDSEYSRTVLFGYCPAYALDLNYRRQLLLNELLGYNADILCLQEVDSKVFKYDLQQVLNSQDLEGEFCQKGAISEGTAIFYDRKKFQAERNWRVLLSEAFDSNPLFNDLKSIIAGNAPFLQRIRDRSTTLQLLLLRSLTSSDKMILVANIHLYFHPDADHVRLYQAILCVKYIGNLLEDLKKEFVDKDISVLWCGDFNSVPECGIYKLLTEGSVPDDNIDWSSNKDESVIGVSHSHNLRFVSACGTPQYTNFTLGFKACLDYIFYSPGNLFVDQVVPLPSSEDLGLHGAIPSIVVPSDHVALISDFRWISK